MHKLVLMLSITSFSCMLALSTPIVSAQEPSPVVDATPSAIIERESLQPQIDALRISYRGIIEDYRNKERRYQIAKQNYQQLNTLQSLEDAIQRTREAIVARTDVLLTYFEILRLELENAEGVEIQRQAQAIAKAEEEIRYLRTYKETANQAFSKEQVLALTLTFDEHTELLESNAYYGLSLLAIGKLQAVHDKSRIIQRDIEATILGDETASDFVKSQRQRALDQTTVTLTAANTILNKETASLQPDAKRNQYENIKKELGQVYRDLSQGINYLGELLKF